MLCLSHGKEELVKRGIANLCLKNSLVKSCVHMMRFSFMDQVNRLINAGYPTYLLTSVAEGLLKKMKTRQKNDRNNKKKGKVAVLPYIHTVSHNLKRIAKRADVSVVFSAPDKLSRLCRHVNSDTPSSEVCRKKHQRQFIPCATNVVYSIPLLCGREYIGQTGRCVNDRLKEHSYNVEKSKSGHLGVHCRDCPGCEPIFSSTAILCRNKHKLTREIIEAHKIAKREEKCVSVPSVALSSKEINYLDGL